ncbi:hypothetical protein Q73_11285 [Bacillus coahuilensis m2-6]|uniref:hypothetical protein n=1 Tax=Bacillus coahuilensis TaxID=408580 RepID=UPI00075043B6|nr:hypothetical protein [Bacillus coahuilensis]KUP06723.1 hypothetical protein Q73_11285 [Bacillus coahuilensis m2-6]
MAQLIKLEDYMSRYATNMYKYPTQFVRLKKQQWERLMHEYENGTLVEVEDKEEVVENEGIKEKFKNVFKRQRKEEVLFDFQSIVPKTETFNFQPSFTITPSSLEDLKRMFLDQLYNTQLKWASSSLLEKSFINPGYYTDPNLKYFLQRFPDTFFVLYKPIFLLKKAPIELETLLITPSEVICLSILEGRENAAYIADANERFWIQKSEGEDKRFLSPLVGLNRTESIVSTILKANESAIPVKKLLLSRTGYIDFPMSPYHVQLVDKRNYEEWFQQMRNYRSPLKNQQIKAAVSLLDYCQTTSIKRLEWEDTNSITGQEED